MVTSDQNKQLPAVENRTSLALMENNQTQKVCLFGLSIGQNSFPSQPSHSRRCQSTCIPDACTHETQRGSHRNQSPSMINRRTRCIRTLARSDYDATVLLYVMVKIGRFIMCIAKSAEKTIPKYLAGITRATAVLHGTTGA
jgi:hypothetical protein